MLRAMLTAFPDLHFTIEDHINGGERVATRLVAEGTNTGPFAGARPTGKPIRVGGSSSIAFSTPGGRTLGAVGPARDAAPAWPRVTGAAVGLRRFREGMRKGLASLPSPVSST